MKRQSPAHERWMLLAALALSASAPWSNPATAQDSHYWTYKYGTRANLLGGVVIGSVLDLSAAYYNPGSLPLVVDPSLIEGAKELQWSILTVERDEALGSDPSSSRIGKAPGVLFGSLTFSKESRSQWAYAFVTRQDFDVRLNTQISLTGGDGEQAAGEKLVEQDLSELWYGATWSRALTPRVGFGVTTFLAYRSQRSRLQRLYSVHPDTGQAVAPLASIAEVREIDYSHYRLLWKLGATWVRDSMIGGIAVTTPGIGVAGSGRLFAYESVDAFDIDGDGTPDTWLESDQQQGLSSDYRSSWAVAGGLSFPFRRTTVHLSAEWFDAVDEFVVLDTTYERPTGDGGSVTSTVTDAIGSVTNFGAGVEHEFSRRLTVYGSFTTDFSAAPADGKDLALSTWNIYHVTGGATFDVASSAFTLGVGYAFGGDGKTREPGFGGLEPANVSEPFPVTVDVTYSQWNFVLGFSIFL